MNNNRGMRHGDYRYNRDGYNNYAAHRGNAGLVNSRNAINRRTTSPADSAIRRGTTPATTQPTRAYKNTTRVPATRAGVARATRYRDTATETRNTTITFIILLSVIVALLALAIYALMRRPHHQVSDNSNANRRI